MWPPGDATDRKTSSDEAPKQASTATGQTAAKQVPGRAAGTEAAAAKDGPEKPGDAQTHGKSVSGRDSTTKTTTAAAKDSPRTAKTAEPGGPSAASPAGTAAKPAQPHDQAKGVPAETAGGPAFDRLEAPDPGRRG